MTKFYLLISLFLLTAVCSFAAPNLINYQGILTDGVGAPINASVSITFKLFDVDTGGTELWSETQTVQILNGTYNVLLGSVTTFPSNLFDNDSLWLEVVATGETLSPRRELNSVPFAINAEDANMLGGVAASEYATTTHGHSEFYSKSEVDSLLVALESRISNVEIGLPPVPTNLVATPVSWNEIRLDWVYSSFFEDGFTVERSMDGINFTQVSVLPADTISHTDYSLLPVTTYHYRINAFNSAHSTVYSNTASAVTEDTSEIIGRLDTAFGSDGIVSYDNPDNGPSGYDWGQGIALDASGRILVAGYTFNSDNNNDMALWRFTPAGALDTTFGTGGVVFHDNAAGGGSHDYGNDVTVQANGKILVVGSSLAIDGSADMVIWRFNDDGTLDTTFDSDGIVVDVRANDDSGNAVIIDGNGKIVVTGHTRTSTYDLSIWRYNPDGTLDTSFDTDGFVAHINGGTSEFGHDIALDAAGRILVAGRGPGTGAGYDMTIWRHNPDGSLDTTFDTDGIVTHSNAAGGNNADYGNAIAIDGNGKILVAGHSLNNVGNDDLVIWRYNEDGTLDTTFDTDGFVTHNITLGGHDTPNAIALDSYGRILTTGMAMNSSGNYDMAMWRFNPDGSLDSTFDTDGFLLHDAAGGGYNPFDAAKDIILDSSGRILVTGSGNQKTIVWRYK